jgi:hypothetical protein
VQWGDLVRAAGSLWHATAAADLRQTDKLVVPANARG